MEECIIEIRHLWTQFGSQVVHRDLNLCVHHREILSLVGGSGSGKTALLRQMLGLEKPARGEVRVFGEPLHDGDPETLRRLRKRWGVLFQEGALFSALSVFDNVALPLRELKTLDEELIRDLVILKLDMVGIEARHADKRPAELSGGMVKRVALARALALEPELLFLDEPTAGLDPDRSESFVKLIAELRRELDLTVVMVTHDLDTLVALSDRVAVLCDQQLVAVGPVHEIAGLTHKFICNFFQGDRGQRALEAVKNLVADINAQRPLPRVR
ncbi:MAG: ABC transporter ATP-binding protein [Betaproteobacteria bacterium RIFCSPLOWO2_12_FULL_62_13]|nr:MAG: ABC transporter ATP-binding protein [Betaproteobacteria bacterium RIFCSPLOWO2_12_FULL_62_13]